MLGLRKAAVLLLSLEKPIAAEVVSQMSKEAQEALVMEVSRTTDVTKEEQEEVIAEFQSLSQAQIQIERGGLDYAKELLEQSLGKDKATSILEQVRHSISSVPFGFLKNAGADNLLAYVVEEHPQTIALILAHVSQSLAAEVVSGLPPAKQLEVIRRLAHMEQTSPEVVRDVEKSLEGRMLSSFSQQTEAAGGVPTVAQILNVTDRMTNKAILENLEQEDPELVEQIKRLMFVFDDIMKLDDKAIQTLMKEVESSQWALALKGASEELKQRILANLSQRASAGLIEEMQYLGPVRVSDVEAMQQQIVDTIRRLEDSGEIVVSGGAETDKLVS